MKAIDIVNENKNEWIILYLIGCGLFILALVLNNVIVGLIALACIIETMTLKINLCLVGLQAYKDEVNKDAR